VPTQVVFVPMLLLLPTPLVPLLVACAMVLTDAGRALGSGSGLRRARATLADAWFSVAPALVLVLAGAQTPAWEHAPILVIALVVQLAGDALIAIARARLSLGVSPVVMRHELASSTASTCCWRRSGCWPRSAPPTSRTPRCSCCRSSRCSPCSRASARRGSTARSSSRRPTRAPRCCSAT